jgi:hypothetical protein
MKVRAFHHLMIVHAGRLEGRRHEVKRATATEGNSNMQEDGLHHA